MESQPQNPEFRINTEFRINPENFHPCYREQSFGFRQEDFLMFSQY